MMEILDPVIISELEENVTKMFQNKVNEVSIQAIYIDQQNQKHTHQIQVSPNTNLVIAWAHFTTHWQNTSPDDYLCNPPLEHIEEIGLAIEQGCLQPDMRSRWLNSFSEIWSDLQTHHCKYFFVFRHMSAQVEVQSSGLIPSSADDVHNGHPTVQVPGNIQVSDEFEKMIPHVIHEMFTTIAPNEEPDVCTQLKDISWFQVMCTHLHGKNFQDPLGKSLIALEQDETVYRNIPNDAMPTSFVKREEEDHRYHRGEAQAFAEMSRGNILVEL